MSRRRKAGRKNFIPDPKYKNSLVTQFINNIIRRGKRRLAERLIYDALTLVGERSGGQDALTVFKKAVDNVKPMLEVKSRRIGGANYQVPSEVTPERRVSLAIRWLIAFSKDRSEKSMAEKLANEFMQAAKNEGGAVRKKIDTHKMAEANKAFAHFRF
jgi:small subunit ribosomal protein S7